MSLRPWYNKDANYQTNAKSFMDYLARTNHFLEVLIEDYDNFQELVIEELERIKFDAEMEVEDILLNWLDDGTLERIINDEVFGNKADTDWVSDQLNQLREDITTHVDSEIDRLDQKDESLTTQLTQMNKTLSIASRNTVEFGAMAGRNVHIYRWGSQFDNGWCFVRTPDNYNPEGKPHDIVILNHGNGWVMNGSLETANFSSKTQFGVDTQNNGAYLNTNREDYVKYSSPLIEAFLKEGYIVAGTQSGTEGQDTGYGNRKARQNIKFFFEHLKENYNVKEHCHMVGASNGALTTLNACFVMGESVRSVTLLYPLTNLYWAWKYQYKIEVSNAYNMSSTTDFTEFRNTTNGHDPMNTHTDYAISLTTGDEEAYENGNYYRLHQDEATKDVKWLRENRLVNDSMDTEMDISLASISLYRKTNFPFPRIRAIYSKGDTVIPQEHHWLAFRKLLTRSSVMWYDEEVSGEHGDYRHFEGLDGNGISGIVNWTKR